MFQHKKSVILLHKSEFIDSPNCKEYHFLIRLMFSMTIVKNVFIFSNSMVFLRHWIPWLFRFDQKTISYSIFNNIILIILFIIIYVYYILFYI